MKIMDRSISLAISGVINDIYHDMYGVNTESRIFVAPQHFIVTRNRMYEYFIRSRAVNFQIKSVMDSDVY
jgi:hypothetical protein